ncbi:unnamed protein product [Ectocarpus sp. 12 AP-2014]
MLADVLASDKWVELLRAPLEHAARQGKRGLVQKPVGAGAEIGNALHAAAGKVHLDIAGDLLENGASITARDTSCDRTPLNTAAREGQTEMVQLLLLKGADKDVIDNFGYTPLYLAVLHGRVTVALV